MAEITSKSTLSMLTSAPVATLRRNHGLEHATLHVLAEGSPRRTLAGHSDLGGFWIAGSVATLELAEAVEQAVRRLREGETELAQHPNCGTNFATAGVMAGGVAALAMLGAGKRMRDKFERMPLAITLATLALILSQPLGMRIQERFTTSGDLGDLKVVEVLLKRSGKINLHRVATRG